MTHFALIFLNPLLFFLKIKIPVRIITNDIKTLHVIISSIKKYPKKSVNLLNGQYVNNVPEHFIPEWRKFSVNANTPTIIALSNENTLSQYLSINTGDIIAVFDTNNNGKWDLGYMDTNGDNKDDVVGYDYNEDGEWDEFKKIT